MSEPTQRGRVRTQKSDDTNNWQVQITQAQVAEALRAELAALPDEPEVTEIEQTPAERIAVMLNEFGGTERAEVRVYRVDPRTKSLEYCKAYKPGDFEAGGLDMVRSEWGAGSFQVRLYATHPENNKFVVRARQDVNIAEPMVTNVAALTAQQSQQNGELSQVLGMLIKGQQEIAQALMQRPQTDPMAQMRDTLALMVTMREAMGLNVAATQQKSSIGEIVEAIKELRGASSLLGGDSEEKEPTMMQMLPQVLSAVQSVAGAQPLQPMPAVTMPATMEMQHAPAPVSAGGPATEITADQIQSLEDDPEMLEKMLMIANLKKLIKMADENKPHVEAIDFVLDKLPDELIDALENEQWFAALTHFAPNAAKHQEYLTAVRNGVLAAMKEE